MPKKTIIYGDSTPVCYSNGLQSGCEDHDWSQMLKKYLGIMGMDAATESFFGDLNMTAHSPLSFADHDPRFAKSGGFAAAGGSFKTAAGTWWYNSGSTGAACFTPHMATSRATWLTSKGPGLGTARLGNGDGAWQSLNMDTGGGSVYAMEWVDSPLSALAQHTHYYDWQSGANNVWGVVAYDDAKNAVWVLNLSGCGFTSADLCDASAFYKPLSVLQFIAPDHTFIACGTNDLLAAGYNQTATMANIAAIVAAVGGKCTLITPPPPQSVSQTVYDNLCAAMISYASANGCGLIDIRNYLGTTWTSANAAGLMGDANHYNGKIADKLAFDMATGIVGGIY